MSHLIPVIKSLNALTGGLFIITAFGVVAARQVRSGLKFFIFQSLCLASSAFLLGIAPFSPHLFAVGTINLVTKVWLLPWLLIRMMPRTTYTRREIKQVVNIPTSLMIALILTVFAYFVSLPWVHAMADNGVARINVPIGLAGMLIGAYTLTTRREAIPQVMGLLTMENSAFFAGVAIAPDLPVIAELSLAFDVLLFAFIVGLVTRSVHENTGGTFVGHLNDLREDPSK